MTNMEDGMIYEYDAHSCTARLVARFHSHFVCLFYAASASWPSETPSTFRIANDSMKSLGFLRIFLFFYFTRHLPVRPWPPEWRSIQYYSVCVCVCALADLKQILNSKSDFAQRHPSKRPECLYRRLPPITCHYDRQKTIFVLFCSRVLFTLVPVATHAPHSSIWHINEGGAHIGVENE